MSQLENINTRTSCVTLEGGSWVTSHTLQQQRRDHSQWASPGGLVLMGGNDHGYSSELLSDAGDSTERFTMKYYTL